MGKRGPAPKPTNLRVLHGDRKDRINTQEPLPAPGELEPVPGLSEQARAVWRRLAPDLIDKGVLTTWDVDAFGNYCDAVVRRAAAAEKLDEQGEVIETKNGPAKNPWLGVWKDANDQVQRWGARFGLTPSDRSQLKVGGQRRGPKEDLLSG